jgi:tRNA-splicing endonuclease subunit Sen34
MVPDTVAEPIPIFQIGSNYMLYDVNAIMHIRREHHMCGVLIGNLPQATQQNILSGIPLELMPEETRLLIEKGHGYIVDDVAAHSIGLRNAKEQDRIAYLKSLEEEGIEAAKASQRKSDASKSRYLEKASNTSVASKSSDTTLRSSPVPDDESLFDTPATPTKPPVAKAPRSLEPLPITPTNSYPLLKASEPHTAIPLPKVPSSYPLYTHLHSKGYYLSPGLRFGCQYVAYPGDPLRYHSHFLAVGMNWDDELDLLDIVGGGRLGTGVKKGYLLGGKEKRVDKQDEEGNIRAFSFEWAVM